MRRCSLRLVALVLVGLSGAVGGRDAPGPPILVQLFSTYEDHINHELSEERLQRTLPLLTSLRGRFPDAHVTCLYQFTGLSARGLLERRSNQLYDALLVAQRTGVVEIGYDGGEEPTWLARPRPNFRGRVTAEQRWLARSEAWSWFLSEGKHPFTGQPMPSEGGGLSLAIQIFGEPRSVWGASVELGGDPELVHLLRRMGVNALLPGVPARDTEPARHLEGYRGAAAVMGKLLSPDENTAPELFWQDHALRVSDYTVDGTGVVVAHRGVGALQAVLEKLDPTRPHVVRVRLGDSGLYTKAGFGRRNYGTPLEYAYDNPKQARLPAEATLAREDIDAAYAREEQVLRWLVTEYFPAHPGSRFVGVADLLDMAGRSWGFALSRRELDDAVSTFVSQWRAEGTYPPSWSRAGARYLSLADLFSLLTEALAAKATSGAIPESLPVRRLFGPIALDELGEYRPRTVTVGAVARAAADMLPRLVAEDWTPVPRNAVPAVVELEGGPVTGAQFLRLMGEAYVAAGSQAELVVPNVHMTSGVAETLPSSRPRQDKGAAWTIKPAPLRTRPTS